MEASEFPPVSLVLLGYNQERFVADAINGAFEQVYPNLEIILSDDASADATPRIMADFATRYSGPHRIVLNLMTKNRGLFDHVYTAAALATGDLLFLAAGDDISYPHRISTTVEHWLRTRADALYSTYDVIDGSGRIVRRNFDASQQWVQQYFPGRHVANIHGASSAYARHVFSRFRRPSTSILFEDSYLSLLIAHAGGKIVCINEPLVQYRTHEESLTNTVIGDVTLGDWKQRERRSSTNAGALATLLSTFAEELANDQRSAILFRTICADARFYKLQASWMALSPWCRAGETLRLRRPAHVRWLLPRLFGLHVFALCKLAVVSANRLLRRRANDSYVNSSR